MKLYKSLLIHVSNVILWASVTRTKLGYVQNPHTVLPETWLLSGACSAPLPTCPLVFTSTKGLHILHENLRRRDKNHLLSAWLAHLAQVRTNWIACRRRLALYLCKGRHTGFVLTLQLDLEPRSKNVI